MLEMLPYPSGTLHMGHVLNYTLGDVLTHFRRRSGWTRPAPDGLRLVRPARRERRDPRGRPSARDHRAQHREHPRADEAAGLGDRLGPRGLRARARATTAGRSGCSCSFFEARARLPQGGAGQLVPERPDGGRERVRDRRPLRALRRRGRARGTWSSGSSRSPRTPTSCSRRPGADRLARADEDDPAQLDRPLRGRRDALPRSRSSTSTSPSSRRGPTRCSARRSSCSRPSIRSSSGSANDEVRAYVEHGRRAARSRSAQPRRRRPASSPASTRSNPVNGEQIPIWVADYVLMDYGTGAIMAVPAHDERDREFAETLRPADRRGDRRGRTRSSTRASSTACPPRRRSRRSSSGCASRAAARRRSRYRLRDWSFSRQRYWGCPIPIVYCDDCGIVPVPDDDLPVLLPEVEDYRPKGKPPLASNEEWMHVPVPDVRQARARREADTMDTFVDSSWYFLRYCDPHNDAGAVRPRASSTTGCPVDQYIGGIDHATGHLLYSRFFVKVLNDMGLLGFREPFAAAVPPGLGAAWAARRCRSRRATSPGPTSWSTRTAPTRCGSTSSSSAPPTRTWSGRRTGVEGDRALPAAAVAARARGRRARAGGDGGDGAAGAQGARDDRAG